MRYADAAAVAAGFRTLTDEEQARADALLEEAAVLIDAVAADAKEDAKWVVSCRMVRRVLGDGTGGDMPLYPMGASQGSATALGYTQSWTMSGAHRESCISPAPSAGCWARATALGRTARWRL